MNNQCGNCIHWHKWDEDWQTIHGIPIKGDCDKIPFGTVYHTEKGYTYDGYSFEDECYDEYLHCFEGE